MGDVGDYWREHKEHKRKVKEKMRDAIPKAMSLLDKNGVKYVQLDQYGEHYRVENKFNWWPSTGYWNKVNGKRKGHRVRSLIGVILKERRTPQT